MRWMERVLRLAMGAVLVVVLVLLLAVAPWYEYRLRRSILAPNPLLFLVGMALALLVSVLLSSKRGRNLLSWVEAHRRDVDRMVAIATVIAALAQIVLMHSYQFDTGWDSEVVKWDAWSLANHWGFNTDYYSTYPNNLMLLRIAQLCMSISLLFGATNPCYGVSLFCLINVASCALTLWLTYWIVSRLNVTSKSTDNANAYSTSCALAAWLIDFLFLWTSPWVSIMYSDACLLSLPLLATTLVLSARREQGAKAAWRWFLFGMIVWWGYCIKPQMIFLLLALALMAFAEMLESFVRKEPGTAMRVMRNGATVVLGVSLALVSARMATSSLRDCLDEERQFGAPHYLMMGLNSETRGLYSYYDVVFSSSFADRSSRNAANLNVARERFESYGLLEYASLLLDKTLITYGDGSFAWGEEVNFFGGKFYRDTPLTPLTESLYRDGETNFKLFLTHEELVWLVVLAFAALALFSQEIYMVADGEPIGEPAFLSCYLALVLGMLTCFQLLFEVRARYLYAYSGCYVLLASFGIRTLYRVVSSRR